MASGAGEPRAEEGGMKGSGDGIASVGSASVGIASGGSASVGAGRGEAAPQGLPVDVLQLMQSGSLELIAQQLVEGVMMGHHRSPFKGSSVEFVEHREYHRGDELRHIDWRAFGKTGRYYVKEFEDETSLNARLIVDASGSMGYAGQGVSKFRYASVFAAALTWLLLVQRDSVGLTLVDTEIRAEVRPTSNRQSFGEFTGLLQRTVPGGETSLADVLQPLLPTLRRRGLVILISDCFDDVERLCEVLQRYRHARHEVVLFRIAADEEETFPFDRPTRFVSLEQHGLRQRTDALRLRSEYLRQYQEFARRLSEECGRLGISYTRLLTSTPLQQALGAWLSERIAMSGPGHPVSGRRPRV